MNAKDHRKHPVVRSRPRKVLEEIQTTGRPPGSKLGHPTLPVCCLDSCSSLAGFTRLPDTPLIQGVVLWDDPHSSDLSVL
jgi:hypothetical protein